MAKNSIMEYTKRVGKSIKFATTEVLKEQMPTTVNTIETNKEFAKSYYPAKVLLVIKLKPLGINMYINLLKIALEISKWRLQQVTITMKIES